MTFPRLERPPVNEVACGVTFDPVDGLDVLMLGTYWGRRKDDYPGRALQPPLQDGPQLVLGIGPLRTWMISADEVYILQIQADRFYLNWRKRTGEYPRFGDHDGRRGVLNRFLEEHGRFQQFVSSEMRSELAVKRVELTKVDMLVEQRDWEGLPDLALVVPWLKAFPGFSAASDSTKASSSEPAIALRFQQQQDDATVRISMDTVVQEDGERQVRALKVESHITRPFHGDMEAEFRWCNERLNAVFFGLLNPEELRRFNPRENGK